KSDKSYELLPSDKWFLGYLDDIITESLKGYDALDFNIPARLLRNFVWESFASHYLEMVKSRAYNSDRQYTEKQQRGAWFTLHTVLFKVLKLLAVLCPFITEKIAQQLYIPGKSIHKIGFPTTFFKEKGPYNYATPLLLELNRRIWKSKTDNEMSLRDELREIWIPTSLEPFADDLKAMHNILSMQIGKPKEIKKYEELIINQENIYLKVK
ncbi:class I tRNA ligase family protein, partial [Candidatus Bathyarchaeota archaeon]|nr:class I tRNA ligase family protein [Candidatus Bathyarchaeota archaeon]